MHIMHYTYIRIRYTIRSSRQEVFCKKGLPKILTRFTGKKSLKHAALLKKRLWHLFFPVNFAKFLRTSFL